MEPGEDPEELQENSPEPAARLEPGEDPAELVALRPNERLLGDDARHLPAAVGHPEAALPWRHRRQVVGAGVTMTSLTLIAGIVLIAIGVIRALSTGLGLGPVIVPAAGLVLVATHWGWVHVAEATAGAFEGRQNAALLARNERWLAELEPYGRWEVATDVEDDGAITIRTTRFSPVASGEGTFTFRSTVEDEEVHGAEEPAAAVSERAELLRRAAAQRTQAARQRYAAAFDVHERRLLAAGDEEQRRLAASAASRALAERINRNLRNPPLDDE